MSVISRSHGVVVVTAAHYDVLQLKARGAEDYARTITRVALLLMQMQHGCDGGDGIVCGAECGCVDELAELIKVVDDGKLPTPADAG